MELEILAQHCADEMRKFRQERSNNPRYCFELLRCACQDQAEEALKHVYAIYLPMLSARAIRHRAFYQSSQDADAFARTAIANFYNAVKAEKFPQKFSALAEVMAYLYTCLHNEILQDVRKNQRNIPLKENPPAPLEASDIELQELWLHICSLLPNENAQHLAYLRFVLEMKPAEIIKHFPKIWKTQREISVALYHIRSLLRKDQYLRSLIGLDNEIDESVDGET